VFVVLVLIEVIIALFVHDSFVRPYLGDVIVVAVIYSFVRIIVPQGCKLLSLYIFIFAAAVEILQYFNLAKLLGVSNNRFMRILLGSTFDISDIVCYFVGCTLLFLIDYFVLNRKKRV
jgi:predicted membrane channel-forming protein YqfA (hemolysin III family)